LRFGSEIGAWTEVDPGWSAAWSHGTLSRYDGRFAARADLALTEESEGESCFAAEEGTLEERVDEPGLEGLRGLFET
jgi:hypothetical protein